MHKGYNKCGECFTENDVDIFVDKTQKKGKTTHVKEDGTRPTECCNKCFSAIESFNKLSVIFLWVQDIGWIKMTNFVNDILVFENEIFKNIFYPYHYMIQKNLKMISPQ